MLSRENLYHGILKLVPDAKFSYWPDDGREANYEDDGTVYHKVVGWCVAWHPSNAQPFPKSEDITAFTQKQIDDDIEVKRKAFRDSEKAKDISLIASYEVEKKSNPALEFSAYLDTLEQKSKDMQDAVEAKAISL
jgi:hypothetical protein